MSNLSELLPTGGGQNSVDFVASGTLSSGQTVTLKADGTVEVVAETSISQTVGSPTTYLSSAQYFNEATYDTTNNKVVISYVSNAYPYAVVGTVSGTSISFGSPIIIAPSTYAENLVSAFDTSNGKVIFSFQNKSNSYYGASVVGTVSGTSISFGSIVIFNSGYTSYPKSTYDSTNNRVIVIYKDTGDSDYGKAVVGNVSGTSISFGSESTFNSGTQGQAQCITFDTAAGKAVIAFENGSNSSYGTAIVGTVSGTNISFGSAVIFNSNGTYSVGAAYDSISNKTIIAIRDHNGGNWQGAAFVSTISGTTISFGAKSVYASAVNNVNYISVTYDPNADKSLILWRHGAAPYSGKARPVTVSGTSLALESEVTFESGGTSYIGSTFDPDTNQIVIAFRDDADSNYGKSVIFRNASTATNSADFIGITAEAISDTATGPVNVYGGINEAQTGLTIASDYYVQADGSLSTTVSTVKAGQAISATTINLMDLT